MLRLLFDSTANQNRRVIDRTEVLLNQHNDSSLSCQVTMKDSRSDAHTTIVEIELLIDYDFLHSHSFGLVLNTLDEYSH